MTEQPSRTIFSENDALEEAAARVNALLQTRARVLIAIDGGCCAGKTTFAARLGERLHANVFHMDDYFLPPRMRTPDRLAIPGGNVDTERFLREVLLPLTRGELVRARRYDCQEDALLPPVEYPPRGVAIVEGAYSLRPDLAPYYDVRLFCRVDAAAQEERVFLRNGPALARVFRERWIPMENAYFAAYPVEAGCDFSFTCP